MPDNSALEWTEIRDFTPGLWRRDRYTMPPNAAQTMLNCYPLPQGGLEPWFSGSAITTTGLATGKILGYICLPFSTTWPNREYCMVLRASDNVPLLYKRSTFPSGSWTLVRTFAAGTASGHRRTIFLTALDTGAVTLVFYSLSVGSVDDGIRTIRGDDTTTDVRVGSGKGVSAMCIHQDRLVFADDAGDLYYLDPGSLTFEVAQIIRPVPSETTNVGFLAPYTPSELLVGTQGPMVLIQGDLADPTLRRMSNTTPTILGNEDTLRQTSSTETPAGLTFIAEEHGIFATRSGDSFRSLSDPIPGPWTGAALSLDRYTADLLYYRRFLIAPTGSEILVQDTDTGAWFVTTALPNGQILGRKEGSVVGFATGAGAPTGAYIDFTAFDSPTTRSLTWTWKSAPIRDITGRQVEIREIQIPYKTAAGGTSTLTVTCNGIVRAKTLSASSSGVATFLLAARASYLDVQIDAATSAATAAPAIEAVRIGHHAAHRTL